jgi:hypothetical protein
MFFSTRKKYENKCQQDGVVTTCRFVCAKQGVRVKDKRDHLTKNARAETRTDCKGCMIVKFDRASLTYKVNDLVLEHNHILQTPELLICFHHNEATQNYKMLKLNWYMVPVSILQLPMNLLVGMCNTLNFKKNRIL